MKSPRQPASSKPRAARLGAASNAPATVIAALAETPLQWVSDTVPGLMRVRRTGGFGYRDVHGRAVRDPAVLERVRRLAIPPAWEDVWICARADGHLQATGRDARGRKQYRYHAGWQAGRGQTKFDHLRDFGDVLPRIRRRVQTALAGADEPTRERVLATLVRLLDTTFVRIGNVEYARDNGSYGLSTLRARHAAVRGAELRLSFVGKSGVRHDVRLADRRVARVVRRCRELPGQELFQYLDEAGKPHRIDSADVNGWLAEVSGRHVTAKDFRTWHGSVQALALTLDACAEGAVPSRPQDVLSAVAKLLGNTPAVCRKAYVHPQVLALGEWLGDDATRAELLSRPWAREAPALRGLAAAERRLMALLRQRRSARKAAAKAGTPGAVAVSV